MKKCTLMVFFSLSTALCHAQEASRKDLHLGLSLLGSAMHLKDQTISKRVYRGSTIGFSLSASLDRPRDSWFANAVFERGFYSPEGFFDYDKRSIEDEALQAELGYLTQVRSRGQWVFFAGGLLSGRVEQNEVARFSNSKIITNAALELGPAVAARSPFRMLHRDWQFDALLTFPLLGYLLRPQYGLPVFDRVGHTGLCTLNRFFRLRAKSSLTYALFSSGSLSLSYEWEYQMSQVPNPLQGAAHRLAIGFFMRI